MYIKKSLSVKVMFPNFAEEAKRGDYEYGAPLLRVVGTLRASEVVTTTYGEQNKLIGHFEFQNLITGEICVSKVAYFPGDYDSVFIEALNVEGTESVNLACVFSIQLSKTTGYSWSMQLLDEPKDPLREYKQKLGLLPKPETADV